jgi:TrmH family RNA methyltransferase
MQHRTPNPGAVGEPTDLTNPHVSDLLSNIRIVLIGTTHPGNITMGLHQLYLVAPQRFPDAEAVAMASGADDLLEHALVCNSLSEALGGTILAVASTARRRAFPFPMLEPRPAAAQLIKAARVGPVALVFGPEHSGLSNEDLDHCQLAVCIPTRADFSSLNLAAAVQILSYELALAAREADPVPEEPLSMGDDPLATAEELEGFYDHLQESLIRLGFLNAEYPKHLMRRLRLLFNRARPTRAEVNILRGILRAATGFLDR